MNIDSRLRSVAASTRDAVAADLDVEAGLDDLKAASRRRRGGRVVAGLVAAAAAVGVVAGLVPLGATPDPSDIEPDRAGGSVTCAEALAGTVSPEGAVQCLGPHLVLVRGPVEYTFRLPRGVPWKISPWGAPETLGVEFERVDVPMGVNVFAEVRAAAGEGGRELPAEQLASWVASRPFLDATPLVTGTQDGLTTWTTEVRPRTGLPRPGPGRACSGVDTDCHRLFLWDQGAAGNEAGVWDGQVMRLTLVDVPHRGVVVLSAWARQSDADLLDEGRALLSTVDFVLPPA